MSIGDEDLAYSFPKIKISSDQLHGKDSQLHLEVSEKRDEPREKVSHVENIECEVRNYPGKHRSGSRQDFYK